MDEMYFSGLEEKVEIVSAARYEGDRVRQSAFRPAHDRKGLLFACALLLVLAVALFHRALLFVPSNPEDLRLVSSVASTNQPLKYFVGDWGEAPYETGSYGMYRPLHPLSLWIVYKIFGVRAFPNQFINFALHFSDAALLLLLIWRVQKDLILSFMGASLFLVSVHTMSPAIWVTDRASLQVGLALLLLLHHLVHVRETGGKLRTAYVLLLSLFALLSKESGLVIPLLAIVASVQLAAPSMWQRMRSAAIWVAVIGVYFAGRVAMFGANATNYSKGGYLFGLRPYDLVADLPSRVQKLVLVDNAIKNVVQVFLPVFNNEGGFKVTSAGAALGVGLGVVAMVVLLALAMKDKLTALQIDCLWVILFNAAIHNQVFRYRILYTAQIAICLFIACAPALQDVRRRGLAVAAACLLLVVSTVRVDNYVQGEYYTRYNDLNRYHLALVLQSFAGRRTKSELAKQILQKYRDPFY